MCLPVLAKHPVSHLLSHAPHPPTVFLFKEKHDYNGEQWDYLNYTAAKMSPEGSSLGRILFHCYLGILVLTDTQMQNRQVVKRPPAQVQEGLIFMSPPRGWQCVQIYSQQPSSKSCLPVCFRNLVVYRGLLSGKGVHREWTTIKGKGNIVSACVSGKLEGICGMNIPECSWKNITHKDRSSINMRIGRFKVFFMPPTLHPAFFFSFLASE